MTTTAPTQSMDDATLQRELMQQAAAYGMIPQQQAVPGFAHPGVIATINRPYEGPGEAAGALEGAIKQGGLAALGAAIWLQAGKLAYRAAGVDYKAANAAIKEIKKLKTDDIAAYESWGADVVEALTNARDFFKGRGNIDPEALAQQLRQVSSRINAEVSSTIGDNLGNAQNYVQTAQNAAQTLQPDHFGNFNVNVSTVGEDIGTYSRHAHEYIGQAWSDFQNAKEPTELLDKALDGIRGKAGIEINPMMKNLAIGMVALALIGGAYAGWQRAKTAKQEHADLQMTAAGLAQDFQHSYVDSIQVKAGIAAQNEAILQQMEAAQSFQQPDNRIASANYEQRMQPQAVQQSQQPPASHLSKAEIEAARRNAESLQPAQTIR